MTLPAEFRSALQRASLLYLTTFSAAGRSGTVPVLFMPDGDAIYFSSQRNTLKVRRIRQTGSVTVRPGRPDGPRPVVPGPIAGERCRTWRGCCCVRTGGAIRCAGCSWARGCADPLRTVPRWSFGSIPRKGLRRPSRREIRAAVFPGRRGRPSWKSSLCMQASRNRPEYVRVLRKNPENRKTCDRDALVFFTDSGALNTICLAMSTVCRSSSAVGTTWLTRPICWARDGVKTAGGIENLAGVRDADKVDEAEQSLTGIEGAEASGRHAEQTAVAGKADVARGPRVPARRPCRTHESWR